MGYRLYHDRPNSVVPQINRKIKRKDSQIKPRKCDTVGRKVIKKFK